MPVLPPLAQGLVVVSLALDLKLTRSSLEDRESNQLTTANFVILLFITVQMSRNTTIATNERYIGNW